MTPRSTAQELAALTATVNAWRQEDQRDREEAKVARDSMAKDIEQIKTDATETRSKVAALEGQVADSKAITDQVKGWRAIVTGFLLACGMLGAIFLAFKEHVAAFVRHVISGA